MGNENIALKFLVFFLVCLPRLPTHIPKFIVTFFYVFQEISGVRQTLFWSSKTCSEKSGVTNSFSYGIGKAIIFFFIFWALKRPRRGENVSFYFFPSILF